jgi:hypothetical protein
MVAARLANMPVGRNWNNSYSANLQNKNEGAANLQTLPAPQISQSQAATMVNVSERSVASAKKVLNEGASVI